jgi:hypothetical protein
VPTYNQEDGPEFGVLFVSGIAHQRPGSALSALSGALYGWLLRWNCRTSLCPDSSPTLSQAVLSPGASADGGPAHLSLAVSLPLSSGRQDARWLLAESSWPGLFDAPRFLDLARWIWKVSTCLLVMQFVIPLRRNLYQARSNSDDLTMPGRLGHIAAVVCYAILMGVAGMLSVLLSILLFALAVAAKLPIPRIELAVRWVVVKISSVLGDSYVLAHCPVQFAAMRTTVARDLRWLQDRCDKVAIVAQSQGAAIAHQVLKEGDYRPGLRAFITLGQVIGKMHLLWHMDWDPRVHRVAWWSRLLVTTGMACAGFPAFAVLASRHIHWPIFTVPAALPWSITLILIGLPVVMAGVILATHAVRSEVEQDVRLPAACSQFRWIDYYASADPVSNGPLSEPAEKRECMEPPPCNEVYNFRSLLTDHNGYLRNQDEMLSQLLNDLVAAAYGGKSSPGNSEPFLVGEDDLKAASRRRRRRIAWLVRVRLLIVALGITQFFLLPMRSFEGPVKRLVRTVIPHAQMSDDLVRLVIALILMTMVYLTFLLLWRLADGRAMLRFLHTTPHCGTPDDGQAETPESASDTTEARKVATVGRQ